MLKDKVEKLLDKAFEEYPQLFLIEMNISPANEIKLEIDGDLSVTVQDCINVSRAIEHNLDREEEDFSLEVASAGATSPLKLPRQFKKNIGRKLEVVTDDEVYKADLVEATDETITLQWKQREPKPIGKGKVTVEKEAVLEYTNINIAKVMLKF